MGSGSICDNCKYCESNPNKKPCSVCIQWVDGYLTATKYVNKNI